MAIGALPTIIGGIGAVKGLIPRKRPDIRGAVAELRASRPTGYLTPEDLRAAELSKGRQVAAIRSQGDLATVGVQRRSRARGLAGSPSEERDIARVNAGTELGVQNAADSAEEQLYNMRTGREAFERQKALDIFGAQTGDVAREQSRQDAQEGAYWNSLNEFVPSILSYLSPSQPTAAATPAAPAPAPAAPPVRGYVPGRPV